MEGLTKVSKLFTRIAAAKQEVAAAKAQQNKLQAHPVAWQTPLLPRVAAPAPRVVAIVTRVEVPKADCHVTLNDCRVGRNIVGSPRRQTSPDSMGKFSKSEKFPEHQNYISQDDDNAQPTPRYMARATTRSIMQEAMLSCIDLTHPTFIVTPEQISRRKLPMTWFCKMANLVLGNNGKLLEYWHLNVNPTTRATWTYSYGNKIGRLAQGMPGKNMGTNTIHFIPRDRVPREQSKDVTYGLITCLIRPQKK